MPIKSCLMQEHESKFFMAKKAKFEMKFVILD